MMGVCKFNGPGYTDSGLCDNFIPRIKSINPLYKACVNCVNWLALSPV